MRSTARARQLAYRFTPGETLVTTGLVTGGGLLLVASAFLPWATFSAGGHHTYFAGYLSWHGTSIAVCGGLAALLGGFVYARLAPAVETLVAVLALGLASTSMGIYWLARAVHDTGLHGRALQADVTTFAGETSKVGFGHVAIGPGLYLAAAAGLPLVVGAVIALARKS